MNDEKLLKYLRQLGRMNNAGQLDDDKSNLSSRENLWKNILEYDTLKQCLKHHDEEVRLAALGLLVESKKSTQPFCKVELELILEFLEFNLGQRFEFVPRMKKGLKRVADSLAVFKRRIANAEKMSDRRREMQETQDAESYEKLNREYEREARESLVLVDVYRTFLHSLRQICVQSLYPGSTHVRKRSSLEILRLSQEFLDGPLKDLPWSRRQADRLFECLLLDTYETNKETIYKIAKDMDPSLFGFDDPNRVRESIDVALELANCIRPIDGITASYILKMTLSSPVIGKVLDDYDDDSSNQPSRSSSQQPPILRLILIVLERLKVPLKLAQENIVVAAGRHSLYGYLFCIRNLLDISDIDGEKVDDDDDDDDDDGNDGNDDNNDDDDNNNGNKNEEAWIELIDETIEMALDLNRAVSEIVNNSSPEGHFPMDTDSMSPTTNVTPQMVLLCSWRTVKEVSLLFGRLTSRLSINGENNNCRRRRRRRSKSSSGLLSEVQLVNIGRHLATLLLETKHRGAFEQAHVGFGQLCHRLWRSSQPSLNVLPKIWLHRLLLAVSGFPASSGNGKLCATRRSAGVPFMVQALVTSDPLVQDNPGAAIFHSVMKILLGFRNVGETEDIWRKTQSLLYEDTTIFRDVENSESPGQREETDGETIKEIKTHSLNILRALFKHAQLGDLAKNYAAAGFIAAIESYDGRTWAERNAATLLFGSLITRIFGVQRTKDHVNLSLENKMTGRIFFERHPSLLPFILEELRVFVEASETPIKPSVQSILLLLSRLYPSINSDDGGDRGDEDAKWKIEEFVKLVSACAKSKVYKTRRLAARGLVPLLTGTRIEAVIVRLLNKIARAREKGLSLNAIHGYTLQIIEITASRRIRTDRRPSSEMRTHLDRFLEASTWILNDLESNNSRSASFPLAAAYVTALDRLAETERRILESTEIFRRLLGHLSLFPSRILKQRPGREMYELAAARFLVNVASEKPNDDAAALVAWNRILSHENAQVEIVGWSRIVAVIEKTSNKKLFDIAIFHAGKNLTRNVVDPDLQDRVYDFVYTVLTKQSSTASTLFHLDIRTLDILCDFVATVVASRAITSNDFRPTPSFIRVVGRAYGKVSTSRKAAIKDERLTTAYKRKIYKSFLDQSRMGSADTECRLAVSNVIYDLFVDPSGSNVDDHLTLNWWTSLLNLLVDDNSQVRSEASLIVGKIEPTTNRVECISSTMRTFFEKFFLSTSAKPSVAFAALFVWSTSLSGNPSDYEMDESDVFNKCHNYEIFEPLCISSLSGRYLDKVLEKFSIDDRLPIDVRDWLNEMLTDVDTEFVNYRELIRHYGKTVPVLDRRLASVTDPTRSDKLVRAIAYERFGALAHSHRSPTSSPTSLLE